MTIKEAAKQALAVQDACNLSGVVHALDKIVTLLWEEANRTGGGTEWVNRHPITVLFVDKLADLCGVPHMSSTGHYSRAYEACKQLTEED